MPTLLYDPPELHEDAARVDPPMSAGPGAIRTPQDVMAAYGDPRDWFRYGRPLRSVSSGDGMSGRARRPRPFIPGGSSSSSCSFETRILYKRELEIEAVAPITRLLATSKNGTVS